MVKSVPKSRNCFIAIFQFIQAFKPPSFLNDGWGSCVLTSSYELYNLAQTGKTQEIPMQVLQITLAVIALASTILAHPLGMLITTGQDILIDCYHIIHDVNEQNYKGALETINLFGQ